MNALAKAGSRLGRSTPGRRGSVSLGPIDDCNLKTARKSLPINDMERRGWDSSPRCGSSYNGLRVLDGVPGPASGPLQHRSPGFCGAGPPVGPDNRIRSCTHKSRLVGSGWSMSALPPKADIRQRGLTSRLVPTADSSCAGGDPRTPKIFGATNSASLPPGPYDGPPSKLAPRTSPSLDRQGGRCRRPRQAWGRRHPFDKSPRTRFRIRYNDVAVVDQLNAKGHDAPQ